MVAGDHPILYVYLFYMYKKEIVFFKKKVVAGDHPILMTECPLNPKKNRERAAEILFDR